MNFKRFIYFYITFLNLSLFTETLQNSTYIYINTLINIFCGAYLFILVLNKIRYLDKYLSYSCIIASAQLLFPATINSLFLGNINYIIDSFKLITPLFILIVSITNLKKIEDIRFIYKILKINGIIAVLLLTLFSLYKYGKSAYNLQIIYIGLAYHITPIALFLSAILIVILLNDRSKYRKYYVVYILISLFLLAKRSTLITTSSLIVYYFYLCKNKFYLVKNLIPKLILFLFICLTIITIIPKDFTQISDYINNLIRFNDVEKIMRYNSLDYLGSGRLLIFKTYIANYFSMPVHDIIFGRLITPLEVQYSDTFWANGVTVSPHNDFIQILFRSGILGLINYIFLLIRIFNKIKDIKHNGLAYESKMILLTGQYSYWFYILHIFIGVITNVAFMVITSLLIGSAISHTQKIRLDLDKTNE